MGPFLLLPRKINWLLSQVNFKKIVAFCLLLFAVSYSQFSYATIFHVRAGASSANLGTSWSDACGDLQLIINNASAGDTIWVSAGTYIPNRAANNITVIAPTSDRNRAFVLKNGVKILGGFPSLANPTLTERNWQTNATILNGDLLENDGVNFGNYTDNAYHVVVSSGVDSTTIIDGFTIRGGSTNTTNDSIIANGNWVRTSRGAGWINVSGSPTLSNLIIKENRAANNNGGGVYNQAGSPKVVNTRICGNQAIAGGGFYNLSGNPSLQNVLFNGNSANNGGGWFNGGGNPTLTNATFSGNNANTAAMAGAWQNGSGSGAASIRNSIFWGNDGEFLINGGNVVLNNCIVQNGMLGGLDQDPKFVNAIPFSNVPTSEGDYRIVPCSPAINGGNNSFVSTTHELNNLARIVDVNVDMGTYEYQTPIVPTLHTLYDTLCAGASYTYQSNDYTTTQIVNLDTFATAAGCDSILVLNLFVKPYITHLIDTSICQGQSYIFNGINYTSVQTGLLDTFTTAGCDSIVTLNLTVNPYITNTINASICQGQSYTFNGIAYTSAQTGLLDTFTTAGCDSIVTLNLTINPYITNTVNATICQGQSYTFNGVNYTTAQNGLLDTFTTAGCDSIVSLNLTINPYITNTVNATICQGQSYTFNGVNYTTSQIGLLDTFATAACDSVVTLNLSITPYITNTVNSTICQGQSYTFNGVNYSTAQTGLLDTFATAACDSIVTLNLSVTPYIINTVNSTICQGQSYTFNGVNYSTAQTGLLDTFTTVSCDSIVTLNLAVNPYITNTVYATICQGQSYTFNGVNYSTAQTGLLDTFTTAGCDSIVTLNLAVNPYITNSINANICQGQSYTFNGVNYSTAQTGLLDTFATAGCDSIVTLNLTVNPFITNSVNATICQGQSYTFNGVNYTTSQTGLLDTFATAGCDSIVTLNLTVNPYISNTINASICQGQSYPFNGVNYTTAQIGLLDTFTTAGCDSIVTVNLAVNSYITNTVNAAICQGQSYTFNGVNYTTAQIGLLDTFNTTGCDSIVTLNLTVNPYIANIVNASICQGQSYTFNGVNYTTAQIGLLDTFTTAGCDSIVTLNLTVNPYITNTVNTTICQSQSYTFNGVNYTSEQTGLLDTFATTGCDSIVTLNLAVNPYITNTVNATICQGQLYAFNGITYTSAQTGLLDTFATTGCDSIVTLNLTVSPYITNTVNATICQGQSYTFNGVNYTTAQIGLLDTFTTTGCDSIVTLNLTVNPLIFETETITICPAQLPYLWNGIVVNNAGIGAATYTTAALSNGCDSTTVLNLDVISTAANLYIDTSACGALVFEGNMYNMSNNFKDTILNALGCDSIIRHVNIVIYPNVAREVVVDTFGCGSVVFEGATYSSSTTLNKLFLSEHGCDSVNRTVNISVENFELSLSMSPEDSYKGEMVTFSTTANVDDYNILSWSPPTMFKDQYAYEQFIKIITDGAVKVVAQSENGCVDSAIINYNVQPLSYGVFIPNAFSPNNDGVNDVFVPQLYMQRAYNINILRIYDRFGKAVYNSSGNQVSWNGNYLNGNAAELGTYHYFIEVAFIDGEKRQFKGDVTLIR